MKGQIVSLLFDLRQLRRKKDVKKQDTNKETTRNKKQQQETNKDTFKNKETPYLRQKKGQTPYSSSLPSKMTTRTTTKRLKTDRVMCKKARNKQGNNKKQDNKRQETRTNNKEQTRTLSKARKRQETRQPPKGKHLRVCPFFFVERRDKEKGLT